MAEAVIFFDGHCRLCNTWVRLVLRYEHQAYYHFAPLQSAVARQRLAAFGRDAADLSSVVLLEHDRLWLKSDAALQILSQLRWPWPMLRVFRWLPRFLRDALYDAVGHLRYRLFGQASFCAVADGSVRARFLTGSIEESDE